MWLLVIPFVGAIYALAKCAVEEEKELVKNMTPGKRDEYEREARQDMERSQAEQGAALSEMIDNYCNRD